MTLIARIGACVIALLASVSSLADQPSGRDSIDTNVSLIVSGGLWKKNNGEYGNFRVIVRNEGWEHTRSSVYLQWLRSDDPKQQIVVLKEVPVSEFNNGGWFNVMHLERKDNRFLISYTTREEGAKKSAELRPGLPGIYRFVVTK
jgi:hypothetical protein